LSGFALANAINSTTVSALTFGCTSSTLGIAPITVIGTNCVESYASFG
jgi:hypothetical protein